MVMQTRRKYRDQRLQKDVVNINLSLDACYTARTQEDAFMWRSRSFENLRFPSLPRQQERAQRTVNAESDVRRSLPLITGTKGRLFKTQLGHSQPNTSGLPKNLNRARFKYEKIAYGATAPGDAITYNVLPPIHQQTVATTGVHELKRLKMTNAGSGSGAIWKEGCLCLRCKMMKEHWELGNMEDFENWGKYPCVPDHVINHEEEPNEAVPPPNTEE